MCLFAFFSNKMKWWLKNKEKKTCFILIFPSYAAPRQLFIQSQKSHVLLLLQVSHYVFPNYELERKRMLILMRFLYQYFLRYHLINLYESIVEIANGATKRSHMPYQLLSVPYE